MTPILIPEVEKLLGLVSPRTDLIRQLIRLSRGAEEPALPIIYQAVLSNFDFRKAPPFERAAAGKGETDSVAMTGAIGEAVERYCASHPDISSFWRAAWTRIGSNAVSPEECVLYSDRQYTTLGFPYLPWKAETEIAWVTGWELPDNSAVLIPAALVYLNYQVERAEEFLCPPTSNGLAAGPDLDTAILHGLYELAERDAFLITWMNRLPAPEVDFSGLGGTTQSIREHYHRFGLETRVFSLPTDLPTHVMMGILLDRSGQSPAAVMGLGCHASPARALTKALFEICQIRPGTAAKYTQNPPGQRLHSYADVRTLEDHSAFFTMPERLPELAFLLENGRRQPIEDLPDYTHGSVRADLAGYVEALLQAGCRVVYADLTTPDVMDFGLRVVRTIATGLQPMHFGCGDERLGGRRLYELPWQMGYTSAKTTAQQLNPCPHPLA